MVLSTQSPFPSDPRNDPTSLVILGVLGAYAGLGLYITRTPARKQRWQVPFVLASALLPAAVAVALRRPEPLIFVPMIMAAAWANMTAVRFCDRCGQPGVRAGSRRYCRSCGAPLN